MTNEEIARLRLDALHRACMDLPTGFRPEEAVARALVYLNYMTTGDPWAVVAQGESRGGKQE
jgi:hypothetical protein